MNVLYCGDRNIEDGIIISVLSLLNHTDEQLNIYILTAKYQNEQKIYEPVTRRLAQKLDSFIKKNHPDNSVTLYDVSEDFAKEPPMANINTRFTPFCMLRLYADKIPNLPDRLLYLDNDVVCRKNCLEFYHQDMRGWELAGVLDHYGKWFFRKNIFMMDYVNSGVMLLNMEKIKETGLFEKCRSRCANKKMFMPDQSAINKLAKRKKMALRCYNEQRKLRKDTVLQHFTTSFRFLPWFHTVSVKPWQINRVHEVLKLYEYDELFEEYIKVKELLV